MTEWLLSFGWNALAFSLVLAACAWWVQRRFERPGFAHALWLLVLLKLLLPGLVAIPGVALPVPEILRGADAGSMDEWFAAPSPESMSASGMESALVSADDPAAHAAADHLVGPEWMLLTGWLGIAWLIGSLIVLAVSTARILRFHRALRQATTLAPESLREQTQELARTIGLNRVPEVLVTQARLSPLVWWRAFRPVIVVPQEILRSDRAAERKWALAHELGHLRRHDHFVRWLEWLAVVVFWWNPVSWWARRNLRLNEEICCDRLVIERFAPHPKVYANSLLNVVEFLARPTLRPPGLASALDSGGALEKRLTMILTKDNGHCPRWMRAASLAAAIAILPMGFAEAQERERGQDRPERTRQEPERTMTVEEYRRAAARIEAAVDSGRISKEDAKKRLAEMRKMVRPVEQERSDQVDRQDPKRTITVEEYQAAVERIKMAVESGRISKEDAEKRLTEMRGMVRKEQPSAKKDREQMDREAAMQKEVDEIIAAHRAGKLTREEAGAKIEAIKSRSMKAEASEQARAQEEEYRRAEARIKAAVESGKISEEDGKRRLMEMRRRADQAKASRGDGRERMELQMQRIKRAHEEGVLTREEAARKIEELKKRFEDQQVREDRERAKRDSSMEEQVAKIKQAHEDGILTREEAARKIEELQKRVQREHDRKDHDRKDEAKGITVEEYRAYAERIKAAVDAGELSAEDAERKLIELRKQIRDRD